LGATLAFEMAQQLRAQGQQVGVLAILDQRLDGTGTWGDYWRPRRVIEFLKNIPRWVECDLLSTSPGVLFGHSRAKVRTLVRKMGAWVRGRGRESYKVDAESCFNARKLPKPYLDRIHRLYRALLDYQPRAYPGRVTLFRARAQPLFRLQEPDLGWRGVACGGLQIVVIPGTHDDLLSEPVVQVLAQSLQACLEEARAGHGTRPTRSGPTSSAPSSPGSPEPRRAGEDPESGDPGEEPVCTVVVNDQGQYSIWPAHRDNPQGWTSAGRKGSKAECLTYINEVWTDMRPLRLRHHMSRPCLPPLSGPHGVARAEAK
jgi:MbtH protein